MAKLSAFGRFLLWRKRRIDDRYFVIFLAVIIGFLAGIAAYLLKNTVYFIEELLTEDFQRSGQNYRYLFYPTIGIFLTVIFIKFVVRDKVKHDIPRILFVISKLDGKMKRHKIFSSMFGSSLTAGFGGSVGLESPIISTGSSLGSSLGQIMRLDYKTKTLLIGCGAAGAMASIFTTPVAAVVFGLEVLMLDLTTASIIPLLIASVTGAITTKLLLAEEILIHFEVTQDFAVNQLHYYLLLGVLCGLVSLYFSRAHYFVRARLGKVKNIWIKALIGGATFGLLLFLFPPLYGEGYDSIKTIMAGNASELLRYSPFYEYHDRTLYLLAFIVILMLLNVVATTITTEAGGIGGIFAPSAVMGGLSGFAFAHAVNSLKIGTPLHEGNFTLVGMAGVLGGVLHAPLTAIFLIAEMTHGYELIVPLMLVTSLAFVTTKMFAPHSIFTKGLAERKELITHHKDKAVLTLMNIRKVIDKDVKTIDIDANLQDLTKVIAKSKRNLFPVVDEDLNFLGMVVLDDVREDMFMPEKYEKPIRDYIFQPKEDEKVYLTEDMQSVMDKFNRTGNYNLLVLNEGKYVGFVSRANVFNTYRKTLIDTTHE